MRYIGGVVLGCMMACAGVGCSIMYASVDQHIATHLSIFYEVDTDNIGDTVYDLDHAQMLLDVDVGRLLTEADDPEKALTQYMGEMQQSIRQQSHNQQALREKRDTALLEKKSCRTEKQQSDNEFFHMMREGATNDVLDEIAKEAATAGGCVEHARVKARAYQLMIEKSSWYFDQLQIRFDTIRNHERMILQHRDLINTDPTTIIQVNNVIKKLQ